MYQKILETLTKLGSPKVLLVGDFLLDVYVFGDALRISPEAPVPVLKVVRKESCCGGAASVAADLSAMGAEPVCLGVIGNDAAGTQLCAMLEEMGADVAGLIKVDDRPTICKQRFVGLAQHKHRQQLMRVDEEEDSPLSGGQYARLLEVYKEKLPGVDIVCLQDYNKGLFQSGFCKELIKLARKDGKMVLVDPAMGVDYGKYTGAAAITPNRTEAAQAVGFEIKTLEDAAAAAGKLWKKFCLDAAIITLDKEGAYLRTQSLDENVPTVSKNVYDVSGAGDMVLAALAATLAAGTDYKTAVEICNIAGGLEVAKFGTATVSTDEILSEVIRRQQKSGSKIKTDAELIQEINLHKGLGSKIVFTNGCFDVIHRGHIEYLKFCKQQGDIVVLGLNSDSSIRAIKGPDRPINNQNDRAAVLAGLESVDYIVVFDEPDPLELIKKVLPDFLVKGRDWADKGIIGSNVVEAYGGNVLFAPLVAGKSSTGTIDKMKSLFKHKK